MADADNPAPACPACGSPAVVRIVYGRPTALALERAQRGELELGGCMVSPDSPLWACTTCRAQFGDHEEAFRQLFPTGVETAIRQRRRRFLKKIISLFQRNYETDRLVRDELVPGAEWVMRGEGIPTRKIDGTSCLYQNGTLYKRYDAKAGKTPPPGFLPAQDPDPITGHWPGWLAISDGPEDRWHREALEQLKRQMPDIPEWTYELIGPKVQGNAEQVEQHLLVRHGSEALDDLLQLQQQGRLSFETIRNYLAAHPIEGIVWWRDLDDLDCEKVKIKRRDFKLPWPLKA